MLEPIGGEVLSSVKGVSDLQLHSEPTHDLMERGFVRLGTLADDRHHAQSPAKHAPSASFNLASSWKANAMLTHQSQNYANPCEVLGVATATSVIVWVPTRT